MKKKKHFHKRAPRKSAHTHNLSSRPYFYGAMGVMGVIVLLAFAQTLVQGASLQFDSPQTVASLAQRSVLGEGDENEQVKQQEEAEKRRKSSKKKR